MKIKTGRRENSSDLKRRGQGVRKAADSRIVLIFLCVSLLLVGCGQSHQGGEGPSEVESNKIIEYQVSASEGEIISVPCGDNARIDISLPAGAMSGSTTLELAPLQSKPDKGWIAAGFHLNEEGENGVLLQSLASISYVTSDELPENASIVKYSDDGKSYKPIPSQRYETADAFGLIAFVESFSAYGVKAVTDAELEEMSDEMEEKGFNWVLEVDDMAGFTEQYSGEISGSTSYEAYLDMVLVNSESPSPFVMNGPYSGYATMQSKATLTVDGTPFGFSLVEAKDDTASFTLYPVFEQYLPEPGSGLPPLSGLVPIRYEGEGVLYMRNAKDIGTGGQDGLNVLDLARQMEAQYGIGSPPIQDEHIPFTVVTEGPMAYLRLQVSNGASLTMVGSIVGYSKGQRPVIVPLPTEEQRNREPLPKTETSQYQDENGTIHYDLDGDGQTDFSLFPLDIR